MSNLLPQGRYTATPTAISFGLATKGTHQVAVDFTITQEGDYRGWSIAWTGSFTPAATEFTVKSLRAIGWQGDDLTELPDLAARGELSPAVIVIEHEEYNGEWRARVKYVNKEGSGFAFAKPLGGDDLRTFAAQMRAQVGSIRDTKPAAAKSSPQQQRFGAHPNAPGANDEIPF